MDNNKQRQKRVKAIKLTNKGNNKSNKLGSEEKIKIKKINNRNMNKVHNSMHSPKIEFIHQQLYPEKHLGNLIPIPMCPIPLHYRGISFRSTLNCGTNGNAMIAASPEHLVRFINTSTASSFYTITGPDYQPNLSNNVYTSTSLTKVVDTGITSDSGLNITNAFERTKLVSFSIEFSITGVSNLSRKGNLYLADEWTGDSGALNSQVIDIPGTASNYTRGQEIANSYPISTIIKMPHTTKELSTSNDVRLRWVWTPTLDHAYTLFTAPQVHSSVAASSPLNGSTNSFIFIAQGCDPTTIINYEIHCVFGADVDASLVNTFPVAKSDIFSFTQESILSAMTNNQKFRVISNYNWKDQSFNILNTTNVITKQMDANSNNLQQNDITGEKLLILRKNMTPTAFKNWMKEHEDLINIDIVNKYSQLYDEQAINKLIEKEKNNKQLHVPGYNYLGPGTKIATNIINGKKPVNHLDELARRHDLDYLDGTKSRKEADEIMLRDLKLPIKPIIKAGLSIGRKFNIGNKNINNQDETDAYLALTKIKKGEIKKI